MTLVTALTFLLPSASWGETSLNFDRLEELANLQDKELRAEWVALDLLKRSIELSLKANQSLGISNNDRLLIKVPTVLAAGLIAEESERRLGTLIINQLTPEKNPWYAEYLELRQNERTLERQFAKALHEGTADVVRLKYELTQVRRTLEEKIPLKPGKLYHAGRTLRGLGKVTVWIGGAAIAAFAIEDAVILAMGKEEALATLERLRHQASEIEKLL